MRSAKRPRKARAPNANERRGSTAEDRARWAAVYESTHYEDLPWFDPDPSPSVRRAVEEGFFAPGTRVLDVGCGAGSNVLYLASRGIDAHGVDLSPGAIRAATDRARSANLQVTLHVGDVLALDFPEASFDGLIDHGCFHTIPIPRRPEYATEVSRVLRPDGHLVLAWVAREHVAEEGPRHRPSLAEVTAALEERFLFVRTAFHAPDGSDGFAMYDAWLLRRSRPQPPLR